MDYIATRYIALSSLCVHSNVMQQDQAERDEG
jgi:hypothetical protein